MARLWAVARSAYIQAVRNRLTGLFVVVILAMMILLPSIARSSSRLDTMRTFIAYSLGFGGLLLSLANIILSCRTLCDDIESHHIYTPITKPVDRRIYLVGRWLGLVLHQATLIAVLGAAVLLSTQYMRARLDVSGPDDLLNKRFFTARIKFTPSDFDSRLQALIDAEVERRKNNGALSDDMDEQQRAAIMWGIRTDAQRQLTSTAPNSNLHWRFDNLPMPAADAPPIQLYIKINANDAFKSEFLYRVVGIHNPETGKTAVDVISLPVDGGKIFYLPNSLITPQGSLVLELANRPPPNDPNPIVTSISIARDDIYILYQVGSFTGNFLRALVLMLALQAFLSSIALLAGTFLSFPVAMLWCLTLYGIGTAASFLKDSSYNTGLNEIWELITRNLIQGLLAMLPDFSSASPVNQLVQALYISWAHTFMTVGFFVVIYSGVTLLLGGLILKHRELARVIAR